MVYYPPGYADAPIDEITRWDTCDLCHKTKEIEPGAFYDVRGLGTVCDRCFNYNLGNSTTTGSNGATGSTKGTV